MTPSIRTHTNQTSAQERKAKKTNTWKQRKKGDISYNINTIISVVVRQRISKRQHKTRQHHGTGSECKVNTSYSACHLFGVLVDSGGNILSWFPFPQGQEKRHNEHGKKEGKGISERHVYICIFIRSNVHVSLYEIYT